MASRLRLRRAPSQPCPVCNWVDEDIVPELPEAFVVDAKRDDWD
jgi:hypothetical protein